MIQTWWLDKDLLSSMLDKEDRNYMIKSDKFNYLKDELMLTAI